MTGVGNTVEFRSCCRYRYPIGEAACTVRVYRNELYVDLDAQSPSAWKAVRFRFSVWRVPPLRPTARS